MVWEETWRVHSKLVLRAALTFSASADPCVLCILIFYLFFFASFFSWREVTFCLKNGRKGSPTQGGKPALTAVKTELLLLTLFNTSEECRSVVVIIKILSFLTLLC